jgi:hypothetical protein
MAITSLSLNRLILVLAVVLTGTARAEEVACPSYQGKNALSSVVLFDGPPEQKADLMPDVSRGDADHAYASWEVGYIFESGGSLFLVCRFSGSSDANGLTIKVEKKVQRCIFRTHGRSRPAELSCK